MKVALIQVDGKMPNLALMKLATWHKKRGDEVTVLDMSTLGRFDRIYASKVFAGGSGIDLKSELPAEIECEVPDYELFKVSKGEKIGFTSRGCIRDCGFCIVREKEGWIREAPFDWVNGAEKVVLLDNNFLASPQWREKLEYFIRHKIKVSFNQGLDIRLINKDNASLLAQIWYYDLKFRKRRLYFAFDDPHLAQIFKEKVQILHEEGIPSARLIVYVLVGYNTTFDEDFKRFQILNELGCLPFIMLYNNTRVPLLRHFARWVNKRYYKVVSWQDYLERRG